MTPHVRSSAAQLETALSPQEQRSVPLPVLLALPVQQPDFVSLAPPEAKDLVAAVSSGGWVTGGYPRQSSPTLGQGYKCQPMRFCGFDTEPRC